MIIDKNKFEEDGYLILNNVIDRKLLEELKNAVEIVDNNGTPAFKCDIIREHIESNININIADRLLGVKNYLFHHVNAAIHRENTPSLCWHQDNEDYSGERRYTMIHIFYYLNGLSNSIGELLLLPGSHKKNIGRYEYADHPLDHFDSSALRINQLESGSIIVINSALVHARRKLQYIKDTEYRYFIDYSYCEYGGKWSPFREEGDWKSILNFLKTMSFEKNSDKYEYLYMQNKFYYSMKNKIIDSLGLRAIINHMRSVFGKKIKKTY